MRITIVCIKEDERLKRCLDSLKKYSPELPIDILRVENPSDKTDPFIEYNKYFEKMKDDIIIWHPDMIATPNWYKRVKVYWNEFDVIGLKLIYPDKTIHHFGGAIFADGRGFHPHQHCLNIGLTKPQECAFVTGPGTIIKRKVLRKIGGYDLQFIKGFYGDVDWCLRARKEGFRIGVIPVGIIHEEGVESIKLRSPEENKKLLIESHQKFMGKHMGDLAKYK